MYIYMCICINARLHIKQNTEILSVFTIDVRWLNDTVN
jgi:hypothetical protein